MGRGERGAGRPRRAPRRWCIPPAMLRDPGDTLDGERILTESPGDFGLLLWCTARDVTLWAATPPDARGSLFRDGSADGRLSLLASTEIPPEVSASVDTIHGMLSVASRADDEILSVCCLEVAAWAGWAGLPHTAVALAQASALASPEFAEAAVHVGMYARVAGQDARAGTWLRRAVGLARRERDGAAYAAALVELGALYEGRSDAEQAERYYRKGFRAGRRNSARSARMRASHRLFRLARQRGDTGGAAQFALTAQSAYEPDTTGAPDLLLDLARFWTDIGEPGRARAALRCLWPSLARQPRAAQLAAAGLAARARAEPGNPLKGRVAARTAWKLMGDVEIAESVRFAAALDLAHSARTAGDLAAFTAAKRAVLLLAPHAGFPGAATEMAALWPDGDLPAPPMERAS